MTEEAKDAPQWSPSPAQRLRALELRGDPDAAEIARSYKTNPLDPLGASMRQVNRASNLGADIARTLVTPNYAHATVEDAREAEAKYADLRLQRERERREREQKLFEFAAAADKRERSMHRMTKLNVALTSASVIAAVAAIIVAALHG